MGCHPLFKNHCCIQINGGKCEIQTALIFRGLGILCFDYFQTRQWGKTANRRGYFINLGLKWRFWYSRTQFFSGRGKPVHFLLKSGLSFFGRTNFHSGLIKPVKELWKWEKFPLETDFRRSTDMHSIVFQDKVQTLSFNTWNVFFTTYLGPQWAQAKMCFLHPLHLVTS